MQTCGEHGDDIAYAGGNYDTCPACEQIDDLKKEHEDALDELKTNLEDEIKILEGRISVYEEELANA